MPDWGHRRGFIGLLLGPAAFLVLLALPEPAGLSPQGMSVAAVAVLMAIWWASEAIPVPATALLPILLFPVLGVIDGGEVTRAYANHLIYLFLGGFLIAVTMEKWNLHHRIALHTIRLVGVTPSRIVLGFMLATAFLSMWISNTAATMMMVTIAAAVLHEISADAGESAGGARFGSALMLGICYAASIGGIATLIGTPPNAIFAGVVEKTYGISIGFVDWMKFGLPLSLVMLGCAWLYLTRIRFHGALPQLAGGREFIHGQIAELGPMSRPEKEVAVDRSRLLPARGIKHGNGFHDCYRWCTAAVPDPGEPGAQGIPAGLENRSHYPLGHHNPVRRWLRPGKRVQRIRADHLAGRTARRVAGYEYRVDYCRGGDAGDLSYGSHFKYRNGLAAAACHGGTGGGR
jgi:di/tricarboxylate transporter